MLKNTTKVLGFIVIFVLLFASTSYALRQGNEQATNSSWNIKSYYMLPPNTVDVVYFGGSSCFTYWAPMEAYGMYGFTSYNFANNTMPATVEKYCVKEILMGGGGGQTPKLLILDVRPFEYADTIVGEAEVPVEYMYWEPSIRNFTDNFRYSFNRLETIENIVPNGSDKLSYHFDIVKYHTNYISLLLENSWKYAFNQPPDETLKYGGFEFIAAWGGIDWADFGAIKAEEPLSERVFAVYRELITYCNALECEVLFIIPPFQKDESMHKKHNYMHRIAEESGVRFLDCNEYWNEIGLDEKVNFYNSNHTNIFGAQKYTAWLGNYLKEQYDLPDRRGEDVKWQRAYDLWVAALPQAQEDVLSLMPEEFQKRLLNGLH